MPEEENEKQNKHETIFFEESSDLEELVWENSKEELGAVEGRNGHQIKDGQKNINKDDERCNLNEGRITRDTNAQKYAKNKGEKDVRCWPGNRYGCL